MIEQRRGDQPVAPTQVASAYSSTRHTTISAALSCTERLCKRSNSGEWVSFRASIASRAALICGINICLAYHVPPSIATHATVTQEDELGAARLTSVASERHIKPKR